MEKNESSNRRKFFNKLVGAAALGGIASLFLGHKVGEVSGATVNVTTNTTNAYGQIAFWDGASSTTGSDHLKWDDANRNFIAGYSGNTVTSGAVGATISGGGESGYANWVTDDYGTVGGGLGNCAGDAYGSTSNRPYATVSGGRENSAMGAHSTVCGGAYNSALGGAATVCGGGGNNADGDYSLAAGRRAKINTDHDGAFIFADNYDLDFNSVAANEFAVRCTGGARFVTAIDGSGNPTKTISMNPSGQLGIGTTSPSAPLHMVANVPTMVMADADGASPCVLQLDSYGTGSITSGGGFLGRFSRGTKSGPTNVAVGDRLGFNIFGGYAGGAFRHVVGIEGVVDSGTVSGSSLPSAIRFLTTPDGSTSRQERMRIDKDGNVGIGTPSPASKLHIDFGATGRTQAGTPLGSGPGWIFFAPNGHRRDIVSANWGIAIAASSTSSAPNQNMLKIDENGNVGVGITPTERLHVAGNVKASSFITGDLVMANDYKVTEDERDGVAFLNPEGEKIAVLDREGNLYVKGEVRRLKDLQQQ